MAKEIELLTPDLSQACALAYADGGVRAGFPSPAQDYVDRTLDLNKELIQHPEATFYAKVVGDSMRDAGVHPGDLLVIDRSIEPHDGSMAVCFLNGEFTLKTLDLSQRDQGIIRLVPANPAYAPIHVTPEMQFEIWGVVAYTIHKR
jgi:DNA polymerase V